MFYHIHNLQTKMPHITLDAQLPGIRGPMAFRPETAKPLNELIAAERPCFTDVPPKRCKTRDGATARTAHT